MPDNIPSKPITITFPDGQTMARIVNVVAPRTRPEGWSRRSYSPYYKERYGEWIRPVLDDMIANRTNKFLPYENFPNVTASSLYQRIHMAVRYLIDNSDPTGKYNKLWNEVKVDRKHIKGIAIKFDNVIDGSGKIEDLVPEDIKPKWKEDMDKYLDDPDDIKPFIRGNLLLKQDEINQIRLELDGLTNIMYSVTAREIKILKS